MIYIRLAGGGVDEQAFNVLNTIRQATDGTSLAEFKMKLREQFFALVLDEKAAIAAISQMLPAGAEERHKAFEWVRKVATATGALEGARADRLGEVERLFAAA